MKKLILSILILTLIRTNIYGESYTIPLSYDVAPTYVVNVPTSIDISDNETNFEFSVCGDIYQDSYLEIRFDDNVTISNGKTNRNVNVSQSKTTFTYEEVANNTSAEVLLSHSTLSSGTWTGVLNLLISLKEGV